MLKTFPVTELRQAKLFLRFGWHCRLIRSVRIDFFQFVCTHQITTGPICIKVIDLTFVWLDIDQVQIPRPMSSYLNRVILVNKDFLWKKSTIFLGDKAGNPEHASQRCLSRSSSQSQARIRFIELTL